MLTEEGLIKWWQHYCFVGVSIIPYFFTSLFSQIIAPYSLEVGCHPLREKTGLSRDTIRFYERNGLFASEPSQSGTNSYRNYPDELVGRLTFISQARDAGMSVADLRDIFQALQRGCDLENGKRVVQHKIKELEDNIAQTRKVVRFLKDAISDS